MNTFEDGVVKVRNIINGTLGEHTRRTLHRVLNPNFHEMDMAFKEINRNGGRICVTSQEAIDENTAITHWYNAGYFKHIEDLAHLFVTGDCQDIAVLDANGRVLASMQYPPEQGMEYDFLTYS